MGVITKPSSVQRSVIVRLLVSCSMAVRYGGARPPAVASRGSIPQTRPPAQGAAHAAAAPDSAQKTPETRTDREPCPSSELFSCPAFCYTGAQHYRPCYPRAGRGRLPINGVSL